MVRVEYLQASTWEEVIFLISNNNPSNIELANA
jgi:hypothetical protein